MKPEPVQKLKPTIKFFFAGWCGPSQAFRIVLNRALESYSDIYMPVEYIDTDQAEESTLRRWKVDGVPTTIIVSGAGRELARLVGYNKEEYTLNFLRRGAQ